MNTVFTRLDTTADIKLLHNFVWLLFKSSYYSRAALIKLGTEDEGIHCLKEG